jgi:hypothetical protein
MSHWRAFASGLLCALVPALSGAKGCYFGAEDVPLGSNRDDDAQSGGAEDGGAGGRTSPNDGGAAGRSPGGTDDDVAVVHGPLESN